MNRSLKANDPGFTPAFIQKMYDTLMLNINIHGKGGVISSPDLKSEGGNHWFHWTRDAALVIDTFIEIHGSKYEECQEILKSYVDWCVAVHQAPQTEQKCDIRVEPKFYLDKRTPFELEWGRPQTDGPALRAVTCIKIAEIMLTNGEAEFVKKYLWTGNPEDEYHGGVIRYDLDWIVDNWMTEGFDLWEEIVNKDFFWNRMAFRYVLDMASTFVKKLGDEQIADVYNHAARAVQITLMNHWNGEYMAQCEERAKDTAVIHAFVTFPGVYQPFDSKIAATIDTLTRLFFNDFDINKIDYLNNVPGMLYGRYEGDQYQGGNPWQALTAVVAEAFYQACEFILQQYPDGETILSGQQIANWDKLFNIGKEGVDVQRLAQLLLAAGDAIMQRLYYHLKGDGGRIDEQINKETGKQCSAKSLTWSYSNILRALYLRDNKVAPLMKERTLRKLTM